MARLIAVTGLGFGDCGKGLFTDVLCRASGAHAVVRFNGGAQAGHNVVLPDGRHHTFSQYGSGSFLPHIFTLITEGMVVHPSALIEETRVLERSGIADPLSRLMIDGSCLVTTPFHQAANRLRELLRSEPHGTCGVGVGETVRLALDGPEAALRYRDLFDSRVALDKLEEIRLCLLRDMDLADPDTLVGEREAGLLRDADIGGRWLTMLAELLARAMPTPCETISGVMRRDGFVILEGAQGVLLDQDVGFHPHTTWSSILPQSAQALSDELVGGVQVFKLGVLRTYLTRHGSGPLPTYDAALDTIAEPHNHSSGWQGAFRRGHPDAVLLRYACDAAQSLDGLMISHLDYFDGARSLNWCDAYRIPHAFATSAEPSHSACHIDVLPKPAKDDWAARRRLTELLFAAQPQYADNTVTGAEEAIMHFEAVSGVPVIYGAYGPTHQDVKQRRTLPWPMHA